MSDRLRKATVVIGRPGLPGITPEAVTALTTRVTTVETTKADTTTVNTGLALKADTATVNTSLATKANTTTVTALDTRVTATETGKASVSTVTAITPASPAAIILGTSAGGTVNSVREFDILAFGAIANDSAINNAAAINAAIAAADTLGGGTVLIPSGDFWHTGINPIPSGVTIRGMGKRKSRLRTASLTANGLTILGASALSTKVQIAVRDLALIGPGKTSGGTGVGVSVKWASLGFNFEDVWIASWGSHGASVEDSYTSVWRMVHFDGNGGDGFFGQTNINQIIFQSCNSLYNGGRGIAVVGGAAVKLLNTDIEGNQKAGADLRYVVATSIDCCDFEGNGVDTTSPNIYLHWKTAASDKATGISITNNNIQGKSVTKTGILVDGANLTDIGPGNRFEGHTVNDIETTANASRTKLWPNVAASGTLNVLDNSASTARFEYDTSNLIWRLNPGLLLAPRSANPPVLASGELWADSTTNVIKMYDGTKVRRVVAVIESTATIDPPSIAAQTTYDLTFSLAAGAGAAIGDGVLVIPPVMSTGLIVGQARVSAADVVIIPIANVTTAAIDQPSGSWRVKVYKA